MIRWWDSIPPTHLAPCIAQHLVEGLPDDLFGYRNKVERLGARFATVQQGMDASPPLEVGVDRGRRDGLPRDVVGVVDERTDLEQVLDVEVADVVERHDLGSRGGLAQLACLDELAYRLGQHVAADAELACHLSNGLAKGDALGVVVGE